MDTSTTSDEEKVTLRFRGASLEAVDKIAAAYGGITRQEAVRQAFTDDLFLAERLITEREQIILEETAPDGEKSYTEIIWPEAAKIETAANRPDKGGETWVVKVSAPSLAALDRLVELRGTSRDIAVRQALGTELYLLENRQMEGSRFLTYKASEKDIDEAKGWREPAFRPLSFPVQQPAAAQP